MFILIPEFLKKDRIFFNLLYPIYDIEILCTETPRESYVIYLQQDRDGEKTIKIKFFTDKR